MYNDICKYFYPYSIIIYLLKDAFVFKTSYI
jgi:hypothetical protein